MSEKRSTPRASITGQTTPKSGKGAFDGVSTGGALKISRKMEGNGDIKQEIEKELNSSTGSEASFAEEEPWIAGFIDLIYVATIMNISHFLTKCGAYFNVWLMAAAYFLIMFMGRYNIDVYSICFLANDIVHRMIFLFYCLGVFIMTLNIAIMSSHDVAGGGGGHRLLSEETGDEHSPFYSSYVPSDDHHGATTLGESDPYFVGECTFNTNYTYGFAAGFVFSRAAIVVLYGISIKFSHKMVNIKEYAVKLLPCSLSFIIMFFAFGGWSPVVVFPIAALVEFVTNCIPELLTTLHFQPNPEALQFRLGMYFMLVLGESMIGLLTVQVNRENPEKTYTVLVFSFLLVFSIGMQFFDTTHRSTEIDHEAQEEAEKRIHEVLMEKLDRKINQVLLVENLFHEADRRDRRHQLKHGEFRAEFEEEFRREKEASALELKKSPFLHALDSPWPIIRLSFIWFHSTICFFMLVATNGFVNLYYDVNGNTEEDPDLYGDRFKTSIGLFVTVLMMVVMRGLHVKGGPLVYLVSDYKRISFKVLIACIHLVIYKFPIASSYCLVIHSGVAGFSNFIEVVWGPLLSLFGASGELSEMDQGKHTHVQLVGATKEHAASRSRSGSA